jgi:hypothetical protein
MIERKKRLFFCKKGDWLHHVGPKKKNLFQNSNTFFSFWFFPNYDGEQMFGHHREINREWRERHGKS